MYRPEHLPYEHFKSSTNAAGVPPTRVLAAAQTSFARGAERAAGMLATPLMRALLRDEQVCSLATGVGGLLLRARASVWQHWGLTVDRPAAAAPPDILKQVRHLEGVQRTATANAVATKLLAATSIRAAAAGAAGAAPAFKATFDFKTALAVSTSSFYPAIVLKH